MQTTKRTLNDGWRVREVPPPHVAPHNRLPWMPAQVPGQVHLDLMRAGVIPDPFARMHERGVAWVDESDWVYETTFQVEDPAPANAFLRFNGLDTLAEIELNGEPLGRTENMYVPHEFSVNGRLRAGKGDAGRNTLRVTFRSALRVGRERQRAWNESAETPVEEQWDAWSARSFVRKAQYMYGWDWGPVLLGCGIWQPVELISVPTARLGDWKYAVEFTDDDKAVVTVTATVERSPHAPDAPLLFCPGLNGAEDDVPGEIAGFRPQDVPPGGGTVTVSAATTITAPGRWQPNGLYAPQDRPHRYDLHLSLYTPEREAVDSTQAKIGLRTIELVREPDADGKGEGFKFRVNGQDVFIKGANWIPNDSFPARIAGNFDLQRRVKQAADAGFNMLRIWGGGLYESEEFYDLCDALGILVWQDFPYACAYYPDEGGYAEAARAEAEIAVRRIRNHASLALWCGNNENLTMFQGPWHGMTLPRYIGEHLYDDILPAVLAAEDPQTPYWPSSPSGGDDANSADYGDCHNWDVWHGRGDWTHYTENDCRFCSEFGFAASCSLAAWDTVLDAEDAHPHSNAVQWHDKTRKGYDTYLGYTALHFPEAQTLEDLVYFTQLNQAEALKYGIEHYRRRKGRCWGTLFWQFNDCWPVQSWAVIDSLGEPKAAYYASKKFYAPVLLSLVRDGETVTAHLVNDFPHAVEGSLTLALESVDGGGPLQTETHSAAIGPNGAAPVATFDLAAARGRERAVYVYARFDPGTDGAPVENFLLLAEPKDLRLSDPGLTWAVEARGARQYAVTLTARRFAPSVWLRRLDNVPLDLSDNFFHVRPGETRAVIVAAPDDVNGADALRGLLAVRTL